MMNRPFNLNFNINNLARFVLLILTSLIAVMIGFSLVIYPIPSLLLLSLILSMIGLRYKSSQKTELIEKADPYIDNFIDNYFKINSMYINETHPFSKSISSLQYLLKKKNIKLRKDLLLPLLFEKLILRFIESNLDYSFRSSIADIPGEKINSLHYIFDKLQIKVNKRELHKKAKVAYLKRREEDFNKFFLENNPSLADKPTVQEWSKAYVDTFENNTKYINFLEKLAFSKNTPLKNKELEAQIESEIEKITIKRNAIKIYQAMASQKISFSSLEIGDVDKMSSKGFERFLKLLFEKRGYNVKHIGGSGNQEADLILKKFNVKTVVQAKKYKNTLNNTAIQGVVAAKGFYNCQRMIVVTNSSFTLSAKELAKSNNIELWDRKRLKEALKYTPIYLHELD